MMIILTPIERLVKRELRMQKRVSLENNVVLDGENYAKKFQEDIRVGIKAKKSLIFVSIKEIIFIEKVGREVRIYLKNDEQIDTMENLKVLEKKLKPYGFFRSHQSYIVSVQNIRGIISDEFMNSYNIMLINSNVKIKLSKHKYKELKDMLITECKVEL